MKWRIALALALTFLACAGALSEGAGTVNVELGADCAADLNGDGAQETCRFEIVENAEGDDCLCLTVADEAGVAASYITEISVPAALWLTDFDGPALVATGYDVYDDMMTYALRYTEKGQITEIMFSADGRTKLPEQYFTPYGSGIIAGMSAERITLESYADVLGTWLAQRSYVLNENGHFVFDDGLWTTAAKIADSEVWDEQALIAAEEIEYTDVENETRTLPAGTRLLITATDKENIARFVTEDGISGTLDITLREKDDDEGIYEVNGADENVVFEDVHYEG